MPRKTHPEKDNKRTRSSEPRIVRPKPKIDFTVDAIDYKNTNLLRQFVTDQGRILPRKYTGLPAHYRGTGTPTHESTLYLGSLILAGFFVQIALDYFSRGLEHGHAHHLHGRLPVGMMAGLCLHAFLEAIALGNPLTHHDPASR